MILWHVIGLITVVYSLEPSAAIRWPAGTYGLPKPASGCPSADGFSWKEGWRLQDTNYYDDHKKSNNSRSAEFHLDGKVTKITVKRSFCIKDDMKDDEHRPAWPPGKYCIYRKSDHCPEGLKSGFVFWTDDGLDSWSASSSDGTLPDGIYTPTTTEIKFCCRTDGDNNDPILLPSKSPFFLLAYNSSKCQMVKWAIVRVEWIYYFTTDFLNDDQTGGAFPYNAGKTHPTIYYCYYQDCNENLTRASGTFQSPNYPKKYPDGQYCSWRILVNNMQKVRLIFTTFSLQTEQNTDELYVYDGENAEGEVLGVFYGGHPPPREGIHSSSNTMFVTFKSDKNDSYTGFSASYHAVHNTATSVSTTLQIPEVTPSSAFTSLTARTPQVPSLYIVTSTTVRTSELTLPSIVHGTTPRTLDVISSSTDTSITLQTLGLTSSSTVITTCTISQTPELTPSFTVTTLKTPAVKSSSAVTTPQLSELTLSPTVTTTTPQTLEVTPSEVTTSCTESLASRNLKRSSKEAGFNVVAVIVPVVSVVVIAVLVAVFFFWRRKRINRVTGPNDEFYLRLHSGSTASDENTPL